MDLYRKIGIDPPRGVLLYGPPGVSAVLVSTRCVSRRSDISCRYRKDYDRQSRCKRHLGVVHSRGGLGIRAEVSRRSECDSPMLICSDLMWALVVLTSAGPTHGPRRLPTRTRELAVYHLH